MLGCCRIRATSACEVDDRVGADDEPAVGFDGLARADHPSDKLQYLLPSWHCSYFWPLRPKSVPRCLTDCQARELMSAGEVPSAYRGAQGVVSD